MEEIEDRSTDPRSVPAAEKKRYGGSACIVPDTFEMWDEW